jgi:hypothetical protein
MDDQLGFGDSAPEFGSHATRADEVKKAVVKLHLLREELELEVKGLSPGVGRDQTAARLAEIKNWIALADGEVLPEAPHEPKKFMESEKGMEVRHKLENAEKWTRDHLETMTDGQLDEALFKIGEMYRDYQEAEGHPLWCPSPLPDSCEGCEKKRDQICLGGLVRA